MTQEFDYFKNPHISKLVDLVFQLGSEVNTVNQRLRAMEMLLEGSGVLKDAQLDTFKPTSEQEIVLDQKRDELLERIMRIVTEDGPAAHPLRDQWEEIIEIRDTKESLTSST